MELMSKIKKKVEKGPAQQQHRDVANPVGSGKETRNSSSRALEMLIPREVVV